MTNEQLSLTAASKLGISIPESFIINTGAARDEEILFATKRYDRVIPKNAAYINGLIRPFRLHQEDFAQALGIPAYEKYEKGNKRYLLKAFQLLRNNVANPLTDQLKLWDMLIYDYLIGNTDNHIKNLSLLYSEDLKTVGLAPAYDIISTVIYQGTSREMAIGIGGERNIDRITREHFINAASDIGFGKKMALKHFDGLVDGFEKALNETAVQLSEEGYLKAKDIAEQILKYGGYSHL